MGDGTEGEDVPEKAVRADAQRSIDALLEAAKTVFARSGVDAPVREIATEAGVGIGTVYRNFPKRSDLIAAVFRREVDSCAAAARDLAEAHPPFEALSRWIRLYVAYLATKRGLAAALYSGDAAYESLPGYFRKQLGPALDDLLTAAVAAGEIRDGVEADDLLTAVGRLSAMAEGGDAEASVRMVELLLDGMRYRAG